MEPVYIQTWSSPTAVQVRLLTEMYVRLGRTPPGLYWLPPWWAWTASLSDSFSCTEKEKQINDEVAKFGR